MPGPRGRRPGPAAAGADQPRRQRRPAHPGRLPGRDRRRARAAPGEAVLEVRDHGPGIPPQERGRVFDRFSRLDASRHRGHGRHRARAVDRRGRRGRARRPGRGARHPRRRGDHAGAAARAGRRPRPARARRARRSPAPPPDRRGRRPAPLGRSPRPGADRLPGRPRPAGSDQQLPRRQVAVQRRRLHQLAVGALRHHATRRP